MKEIKFKISETSLRYGIFNNYERGHTPSVETELNQSKDPDKWRWDILELRDNKCRLKDEKIPEELIRTCLSRKKADTKVTDIFVFKNIMVNGEKLDTDYSFCMYIKEETSETANVLTNKDNKNTHLGRLMLHYPTGFDYRKDGYNINNKAILKKIMETNGNYAFVVSGFIYYPRTNTLNFLVTLVGPSGILQTTVFKEGKGVGAKLKVTDDLAYEDNVIITCKHDNYTGVDDLEIEEVNKIRSKNGLAGEEFIFNKLKEKLLEENELFHTSKTYRYSPYDIEYIENGIKKYIEVKTTQGTSNTFNISKGELKFMDEHKDNYTLYIVKKINSEFPEDKAYTYNELKKKMKIEPVKYRATI